MTIEAIKDELRKERTEVLVKTIELLKTAKDEAMLSIAKEVWSEKTGIEL